jgi:hypothetical protein
LATNPGLLSGVLGMGAHGFANHQEPSLPNYGGVWLAHKQKAAELGAQGLTLRSLSSFADYVEIEKMKLGMVIEA